MATSLASQLSSLKQKQKDTIKLSDRTKLSFLFDIKQAANIDDETIYYLCQGGLSDIEKELPQLFHFLKSYQEDIFNKKSLEFYRGTETKEVLQIFDEKLKNIIMIMAPYFLSSTTHKLLEYLVRIYEIHAYHKHTLVLSFLPYFETAFFLRLIQILNIEKDEYFFFFYEYAFKGLSIDKKTLLKGLSRNDGQLFALYANFCFEILDLHSDMNSIPENSFHWKFFGTMLSEILRSQSENQVLMFTVLPFIAKGMKSNLKEMKIGSLMAISQISSRKTLSQEYAYAFLQEVLNQIVESSADKLQFKLQCFTVVLVILQYQTYDVSNLLKNIAVSFLYNSTLQLNKLKNVLSGNYPLNCFYKVIEATLYQMNKQSNLKERGALLLQTINEVKPNEYQKCLYHILKQITDTNVKDSILSTLSNNNNTPNLISKFGEKEYSLLSALGSQNRISKLNALKSIANENFINKISNQEKDLIKIQLFQILLNNREDEECVMLILEGVKGMVDKSQAQNTEFERIEEFLNENWNSNKYSKNIIEKAIKIALSLQVNEKLQETKQTALALFTNQTQNIPHSYHFLIEKGQPVQAKQIAQNILNHLDSSAQFFNQVFTRPRNYYNFTLINETLQNISQLSSKINQEQKQLELIQFYNGLLTSLKQFESQPRSEILLSIVKGIPHIQANKSPMIHKALSKVVKLSVEQKQLFPNFDIQQIHSIIFTHHKNSSIQKLAEFYLQVSLESSNSNKVLFSLSALTQLSKHRNLNPQIMISAILILINSDDQNVREKSLVLAETITGKNKEVNVEQIDLFTETDKPRSAQKKSKSPEKQPLTPLKSITAMKFLSQILKYKNEIIQDKKQSQTVFQNKSNSPVFEVLIRNLLDLPNLKIKQKFLQTITMCKDFSVIFSIELNSQFQKEYYTFKQKQVQENREYLRIIANLIQKVCSQQNEQVIQHISSLGFHFLQFVFQQTKKGIKMDNSVEKEIASLLSQAIFREDVLQQMNLEQKQETMRYFLNSQRYIQSEILRQQIKQTFIENTKKNIAASELQGLIAEFSKSIQQNEDRQQINQLEIMLDLVSAYPEIKDGFSLLPSLLKTIQILSISTEDSSEKYYCFELCIQCCSNLIDAVSQNKKSPKKDKQLLENINDLLKEQLANLKDKVHKAIKSSEKNLNDPFQQFLMEVDEQNGDNQQLFKDEALSNQFQIMKSCFQLFCKLEKSFTGNNQRTEQFLYELSKLVESFMEHNIAHRLFRNFHNLNLKYVKLSQTEVNYMFVISYYIDTLLSYSNVNSNTKEIIQYLDSLLDVLRSSKYQSFAFLVLLSHAKDEISVKDNLQLDSTALKFCENILLRQNIEASDILNTLEEVIYILSFISLKEEQPSNKQEKKYPLLFKDESLIEQRRQVAEFIQEKYINDSKDMRRFKYVSTYFINDFINTNASVQRQLAYLVHAKNASSQEIFDSFFRIYISIFLFHDSIQQTLQQKQYEDGSAKKSLKRLNLRVQTLSQSFNQLISYEVHVNITLSVLRYKKDSKTLSLKTQTTQQLNNKLPQFQFEMSQDKQSEMVKIFKPLIAKVIDILEQYNEKDLKKEKKSNEYQLYIQTLFSLISKNMCKKLDSDLLYKILQQVFFYSKLVQENSLSMLLHSQIILTMMTIFEVFQTQILEFLPTYIEILIQAFDRISNLSQEKHDYFEESFVKAVLKATLSVCTFFSKFLNAEQFEQLFMNTLVLSDLYSEEILSIYEILTIEATKNVGLQVILRSVINTFDAVLLKQGIKDLTLNNIHEIAIFYFNNLLKPILQRMKKDFYLDHSQTVFKFFKTVFSFTEKFNKRNSNIDMNKIEEVEESIVKAFEQFVIKLNEDQLRPMVAKLTKWGFQYTQDNLKLFKFRLHKVIMFFKVMNGLTELLREFFVPFINIYIDQEVEVFETVVDLFQQEKKKDKKRSRDYIELTQASESNHNMRKLLVILTQHIRLSFTHDNNSFIQSDIFEKLITPTANIVSAFGLEPNYLSFIEVSACPMILDMVDRINNDDMWKKLNYEILMKSRSEIWQIRLGSFKIVEYLFNKIGERYLMLLNDTLPFLSEGLEDENNDVEMTAKSICRRIEIITGDSIQEYLK